MKFLKFLRTFSFFKLVFHKTHLTSYDGTPECQGTLPSLPNSLHYGVHYALCSSVSKNQEHLGLVKDKFKRILTQGQCQASPCLITVIQDIQAQFKFGKVLIRGRSIMYIILFVVTRFRLPSGTCNHCRWLVQPLL